MLPPRALLREADSLTAVARTRYLTALHPDVLTATLIQIYRDVRRVDPEEVAKSGHV